MKRLFLVLIVVSCNSREHMNSPTFDSVRAQSKSLPIKELSIAVVRVKYPDRAAFFDILTPIPDTPIPEFPFEQGLAPEAVVGRLKRLASNLENPADNVDAGFGPEDLIVNSAFTNLLQHVVARHAPEVTDYTAQAKQVQNGWLYVIDGRTRSSTAFVPVRDVLGAFMVRDGTLVTNSYQRNDHYVIYSEDGFLSLHEALIARLLDELFTLNAKRKR